MLATLLGLAAVAERNWRSRTKLVKSLPEATGKEVGNHVGDKFEKTAKLQSQLADHWSEEGLMATASVRFDRCFVTDPANPTVPITYGSASRTNTITLDAEFRQYVGRIRLITRTVTTRSYQFTLRMVSNADARKMETPVSDGGWLGKTLLFRDTYGRRVWGVYTQAQRADYPPNGAYCDLSLTFVELLGYDESV